MAVPLRARPRPETHEQWLRRRRLAAGSRARCAVGTSRPGAHRAPRLRLGGNGIGDEGAARSPAPSAAAHLATSLTSTDERQPRRRWRRRGAGEAVVGGALLRCESLELHRNEIGDRGVTALAKRWATPSSATSPSSRCAPTDWPDGAKALAASTGGAGAEGVRARAPATASATTAPSRSPPPAASRAPPALTRLILDDNGVGDLRRCALADALRNYAFPNLVTLYALDAPPTDGEREGRGGTARLVRARAPRGRPGAGA